MQRTVKAAWTPPSFYSSSNNSPVSPASASNRSDKRVLAKHCRCFDHAALGRGKKAWSNKVSRIQHLGLGLPSEPHSLWGSGSLQEATASRSHSLKWRKSVGGTGMLARAGAVNDLIVSPLCLREWDHMSQANYSLFIYLSKVRCWAWEPWPGWEILSRDNRTKGTLHSFSHPPSAFCFTATVQQNANGGNGGRGSRCTGETGQHINSLIDRRLLRG